MKIYFIRHGQTNYNKLNLCNDDSKKNVYLTDFGREQVNKVAEKLKDIKFNLVFVSNLPRTQETARIITKNQKINFKIDSRINDRKSGFEGKSVSSFYKAVEKDRFNFKPKGGESFQEEKKRVISFLENLKKLKYNTILVVTHGEPMQIINGYYKKYSDQKMWDTKIDNCYFIEVNL